MNFILSIGVLIFTGFLFGELAAKIKFPRISGYILSGILLNPNLLSIMSSDFVSKTAPLLSVSLAFITFSIGGSLSVQKLRKSGKTIILLTLFEASFAFISVFIITFLSLTYFIHIFSSSAVIIATSLILATLATPTDPSATLAVIHEYKAKGVVSSSMLEIAAFDDIIGIIFYTVVTAFAAFFMSNSGVDTGQIFKGLGKGIGGAIALGAAIGFIFNLVIKLLSKPSEGALIVLVISMVLLSYSLAIYFEFDALLSTMTTGTIVVNFNLYAKTIFKLIERYTDKLIFVVFFTLSGMQLNISAISGSVILIILFIIARALGKFTGIFTGSTMRKTDPKIKKYTAGGLIPQGGIVIGLALLLTSNPMFKDTASMIIGIVIGATLIHEIIGPLSSRYFLKKAGEIK